jgi:hypothetical protein
MRLDETMDEFPQGAPARRKLAQDAYEQGLRGQRAAEHWRRVEAHASRIMAAMMARPEHEGLWADVAERAVAAARKLVKEIDRQRAEEEGGA